MSKKANKSEDDAEAGAGEAQPGGKKKLVMIAGAAVLLGALGGGGWFFFMKKPPTDPAAVEAAAAAAKKQAITFVEMKEMMIGISAGGQQDRQPIIKIKVVLEIADPKTSDQVKPLLPRVEDAFQVFMRELRPADLEGSAGMYRLKEELLRRVNVTVYPARVDAVLFKELLLQ